MTDADEDQGASSVLPCGEGRRALPADRARPEDRVFPQGLEDLGEEARASALGTCGERSGRKFPADPPPWLSDFFDKPNWERLIRIARRIGARTHSEAAEAVAAALRDVADNAQRINHPHAYARTAILHHLPRERRHFTRPRALAAQGAGTPEHSEDARLNEFEDSQWVLGVLRTLPPKQCWVMTLYYDGYEIAEIAMKLGVDAGNVRANLHLARQKLSKHEDIVVLSRSDTDTDGPCDEHLSVRTELNSEHTTQVILEALEPATESTSSRKE